MALNVQPLTAEVKARHERRARCLLVVIAVVLAGLTLILIPMPPAAGPVALPMLTGVSALLCLWLARRGSPRAVSWLDSLLTGWP